MLLHHYSKDKHNLLKTKEQQGIQTPPSKESKTKVYPGSYNQQISFFLEPIINNISTYFTDHPFWKKGEMCYHYVINSDDIGPFKFIIVETPNISEAIFDDDVDEVSFQKLYKLESEKHTGVNSRELNTIARPYLKYMKQAFNKRDDYTDSYRTGKQYAAAIPHVLIYPSKPIKPQLIEEITLG